MQIKIVISEDGKSSTMHVASLLFDLWEDYTYYRGKAESTNRCSDPLEYKRHVRAAIQSYFGYFEGVLNSWIANLDPTIDLEEMISFGRKLGLIRQHVGDNQRVPYLDIERAREIRNTIVHVKPTDKDVDIMETLLNGQFFRDADGFTNWLRLASHALQLERHPNVQDVLKSLGEKIGN